MCIQNNYAKDAEIATLRRDLAEADKFTKELQNQVRHWKAVAVATGV